MGCCQNILSEIKPYNILQFCFKQMYNILRMHVFCSILDYKKNVLKRREITRTHRQANKYFSAF